MQNNVTEKPNVDLEKKCRFYSKPRGKIVVKSDKMLYAGFTVTFKYPMPRWKAEGIAALLRGIDEVAKMRLINE